MGEFLKKILWQNHLRKREEKYRKINDQKKQKNEGL
jgi:hypothetical protein